MRPASLNCRRRAGVVGAHRGRRDAGQGQRLDDCRSRSATPLRVALVRRAVYDVAALSALHSLIEVFRHGMAQLYKKPRNDAQFGVRETGLRRIRIGMGLRRFETLRMGSIAAMILSLALSACGSPSLQVGCDDRGRTRLEGEYFYRSCNGCKCTSSGEVTCTAAACPDGGATPEAFTAADAGSCAPERRNLSGISYEVRYPCGIPGGAVEVRDSRCRSLCQPATVPPLAANWNCGSTDDPLVVYCFSGTLY